MLKTWVDDPVSKGLSQPKIAADIRLLNSLNGSGSTLPEPPGWGPKVGFHVKRVGGQLVVCCRDLDPGSVLSMFRKELGFKSWLGGGFPRALYKNQGFESPKHQSKPPIEKYLKVCNQKSADQTHAKKSRSERKQNHETIRFTGQNRVFLDFPLNSCN